jgi:hypothetical protein
MGPNDDDVDSGEEKDIEEMDEEEYARHEFEESGIGEQSGISFEEWKDNNTRADGKDWDDNEADDNEVDNRD